MCFSPEASFAGGVIISSIGIFTIRKVHNPTQIVFASIPLFFGIQQFAEGCLWLTLPLPDYLNMQKFSTYFFMVMAQVIWPSLIPLSVLLMEEKPGKKKLLRILLVPGIALSLYYASCLITFDVTPRIVGYHIQYDTGFPHSLSIPAFIIYLFATITPLFVSSIKRTHLMGILMFLSCLVTGIFFTQFLTSVWCFFAAILSAIIYWILSDAKRDFNLAKMKIFNTRLST